METFAQERVVCTDSARPPYDLAIAHAPSRREPPPRIATSTAGLSDKALERTIAYIHAHLLDDLRLGDLARVACVSRFHFARMFRVRTGFSPMKYVRNERIEIAKRLLHDQVGNISGIAAALGFFDQSHFSRVFRNFTGVSPGRYAQRQASARNSPD